MAETVGYTKAAADHGSRVIIAVSVGEVLLIGCLILTAASRRG